MENVKRASFGLNENKFHKLNFNYDVYDEDLDINLNFHPEGEYYSNDNSFKLTLTFNAISAKEDSEEELEGKSPFISCEMVSTFSFNNISSFEEIPDFFYKNSIAIIFPYLRAFISTISLQANQGSLILPTMNLGSLEEVLRKNTKSV